MRGSSREFGEAAIAERTIDQQVAGLVGAPRIEGRRGRPVPRFQPRKIVEPRQAGIGDETPGAEAPEVRLARERLDGAISGRRSRQDHVTGLQRREGGEIVNEKIEREHQPRG